MSVGGLMIDNQMVDKIVDKSIVCTGRAVSFPLTGSIFHMVDGRPIKFINKISDKCCLL